MIGIRLAKGDRVLASEVARPDHDLLIVTQNGMGKRSDWNDYRKIGRGGKGVTAMKLNAKTGEIVGAAMVTSDHDIMLMSTLGSVIRLKAKQLRTLGRATQGVMLKKLDEGEFIASVTVGLDDDDEGPGNLNGNAVELTAE